VAVGLFIYKEIFTHDEHDGEGNRQVHEEDPADIILHRCIHITKNLIERKGSGLDDVDEEKQCEVDKNTTVVRIFGDNPEGQKYQPGI
jgi:serine kinase of HPr protein (carbohydrate metabolism regulator)